MSNTILVIDDEPDICQLIAMTLNKMSLETVTVGCLSTAKAVLNEQPFKMIITDLRLPDGDGLSFVEYVQKHFAHIPIAVITAHASMELAIDALKKGAFDFVAKPLSLDDLRALVEQAIRLRPISNQHHSVNQLIGKSESINQLRQKISKVSRSQAPVYIHGASGVGKELVARLIHSSGPRNSQPFIPVNCGAIPQDLMESEFFGHIKGSFTGATHNKIGFFQAAKGGTLFLDEVADLPINMQVKLLRAIQEKAVRPVGSNTESHTDVRILSATHKNLKHLVKEGVFREDLYYRLNVIELMVPCLKDRAEDIGLLTNHLLHKIAEQYNINTPTISKDAEEYLTTYDFPGNIRELENILERALALSSGSNITLADLDIANHNDNNTPQNLDDYLVYMEKSKIEKALCHTKGNVTKAAEELGISFRTLRYRIKKLGLENKNAS